MANEFERHNCVNEPKRSTEEFTSALKKIVTSDAASARAAIQAAQATKPSRHTRFVYDPAEDRA